MWYQDSKGFAGAHSSQRAEYERLQFETSELAIQLAQAIAMRAGNLAQDNTRKLNQLLCENGLLQKQLGDLGHQVQSVPHEIARRNDSTLLHMAEDVVQHIAAADTDTHH